MCRFWRAIEQNRSASKKNTMRGISEAQELLHCLRSSSHKSELCLISTHLQSLRHFQRRRANDRHRLNQGRRQNMSLVRDLRCEDEANLKSPDHRRSRDLLAGMATMFFTPASASLLARIALVTSFASRLRNPGQQKSMTATISGVRLTGL